MTTKIIYIFLRLVQYYTTHERTNTEKGKELAGLVLVCFAMSIVQVIYCFIIGLKIDASIALLMAIFYILGLTIYRHFQIELITLGRAMVVTSILGIWAVNMDAGMGVNPSMIWYPAIPLFAIIATGVKEGLIWTLVSIALSFSSMYLAKHFNYTFNEFNSSQWFDVGSSNLITAPLLIYFILSYFYFKKNRDIDINSKFAQIGMNTSYLVHELGKPIFRLKNNPQRSNEEIEKIIEVYTIINDLKKGSADKLEEISLNDIIKKTIHDYENILKELNINIVDKCENLKCIGNKASIEIIIKNLLTNAIEAAKNTTDPCLIIQQVGHNTLQIENNFIPNSNIFNEDDYILNSSKSGNLGVGLVLTKQLCLLNNIKFEIRPDIQKNKFKVLLIIK